MINRDLLALIIKSIKPGFVNIITGPRRVGKTVLLKQIAEHFSKQKPIWFNGDTQESRDLLQSTSDTTLTSLVKNHDLIMIDEAQRISNIGLSLKIIIDKFPDKKIFVTGSSSLELTRGVKESLTGRKTSFILYPLSTKELAYDLDKIKIPYLLSEQLIYGGYPFLTSLTAPAEKQKYLSELIDDYLFRDILWLERIENPDLLKKLCSLLAFQIGQIASVSELANSLNIDQRTVARYIGLLEKSFILFSVNAYSNNLRKEITKNKKYYFYDLGIRNALISQFLPLDSRLDIGALWENFLFIERRKLRHYTGKNSQYFFWRNYQKAEIDMVEIDNQHILAFEFKWSSTKKYRTPKMFKNNYHTEANSIDKKNYLEFLGI